MVKLTDIQSSNRRIATELPSGLVAVFVGATSGIGEYSLIQFAKHANKPKVYIIGRSQEAADRIVQECKVLNPEGTFVFIKSDVSLIKNVDQVCDEIKSKESTINLLFNSTGTLLFGTKTSEDLHLASALPYYSRTRFIINLLPLIRKATSLRRVVSVFAATKEGEIYPDDFQCLNVSMIKGRGHLASMITLSLEQIAKTAPEVSFVHEFPGPVRSNIIRGGEGFLIWTMHYIFKVIGPLFWIPNVESGERHLFISTSGMYPASTKEERDGIPLEEGLSIARGTDSQSGSGVYSLDEKGESAPASVEQLLQKFRKEGMLERLWNHTLDEYKRITSK